MSKATWAQEDARQARRLPRAPAWATPLRLALAFSLAAHAGLLFVKFGLPEMKKIFDEPVVITALLVNTSTKEEPQKAQRIAQANLDGGGVHEGDAIATSPLKRSAQPKPGDLDGAERAIDEEIKKQRELEQSIEDMLAQAREKTYAAPTPKPELSEQASAQKSKLELDLAAKIERDLVAYASRPKKKFIGASAVESDLAAWVEGWQRRVEVIGNEYYPEGAKGRVRGELVLTAAVRQDGKVEAVVIERSSGHRVLDEAAKRIVSLCAPFEPFDARMRKSVDIIYITRLWRFGPNGVQQLQASGGE